MMTVATLMQNAFHQKAQTYTQWGNMAASQYMQECGCSEDKSSVRKGKKRGLDAVEPSDSAC